MNENINKWIKFKFTSPEMPFLAIFHILKFRSSFKDYLNSYLLLLPSMTDVLLNLSVQNLFFIESVFLPIGVLKQNCGSNRGISVCVSKYFLNSSLISSDLFLSD